MMSDSKKRNLGSTQERITRQPVCPWCGNIDTEIHDCPCIVCPGDADYHECDVCGKPYRVEMVEGYVTERADK
jgi:hypothetical protein